MVGPLPVRLAKFSSGIKGLAATLASRKARSLPLGERIGHDRSSANSSLISQLSRGVLAGVFERRSPSSAVMSLPAWSAAFAALAASPTQPSLHPDDMQALHEAHGGDYERFLDALFPPPPPVKELVKSSHA